MVRVFSCTIFFICSLFILVFCSCSELNKKGASYLYVKGKSSVELQILDGNDFLIYEQPALVNFKWINIDPKTGSIYGTGIRMIETKNGITKTEIIVPSNYLEKDTLNIKLRFKIEEEIIKTEFNVPIRNNR